MRTLGRSTLVVALFAAGCALAHERPNDAGPPIDAPRVCPAMNVHTFPECTWGPPAFWWWDGSACVEGICVCAGSDCGATYVDEASCRAAYVDCRR